MGCTINSFNLSNLSPFPMSNTVVFLQFATGTSNKDAYEGPYSLNIIKDYPGCSHRGERCVARYHKVIDSPQEL